MCGASCLVTAVGCDHDSCKGIRDVCEGLCGEWHQEDPPMDDVALLGEAHIRKGSGICCCVQNTLMNMHL